MPGKPCPVLKVIKDDSALLWDEAFARLAQTEGQQEGRGAAPGHHSPLHDGNTKATPT